MPLYYDSTLIILLPAMLLTLIAQFLVKSAYRNYVAVGNRRGITGEEAARRLLEKNMLYDVRIERVGGEMSDHYDPKHKVVRLSPEVYGGRSIASAAIAAHEVGHALQHASEYTPLVLRSVMVPYVNFATNISWFFVIGGLALGFIGLLDIGILLFSLAVMFQLLTLPVEFNASKRALAELESTDILMPEELSQGRKVLNAAALTYVAAAATAASQLIRLMALRGRRRD
ncbi:MAG: zinc metallopeptidase [Peptostreptococcaceae bacterium]|nr:zinc metallopeptidase [Peptostreptococcaceae bacterium]